MKRKDKFVMMKENFQHLHKGQVGKIVSPPIKFLNRSMGCQVVRFRDGDVWVPIDIMKPSTVWPEI